MDKRYSLNQAHQDGSLTTGQPGKYATLSDAKNAAYDTAKDMAAQVILQWTHGQSQPTRQWARYRLGGSWGIWHEVTVRSLYQAA